LPFLKGTVTLERMSGAEPRFHDHKLLIVKNLISYIHSIRIVWKAVGL
jgi:hypothetical protein